MAPSRIEPPRKNLLLFGASGHGRVIADIAERSGRFNVRGYVDDDPDKTGRSLGGLPVLGTGDCLERLARRFRAEIIVSIGSNRLRGELGGRIEAMGLTLAVAVHPCAVLAADVELGAGAVVMAGAVLNAGCAVGRNVIVNTGATIDHECVLEDGVHVSPGAHLAGNVRVGREAHVGIGAAVIQNIRIGARSIVGAGAVVIRDVPDSAIVAGNPARSIESARRAQTHGTR